MAGKKTLTGPTGHAVRSNISRLRDDQNLTFAELSRKLGEIGNPIPPLGLRRIENDERAVSVDDLTAIAYVLGVSPAYLLQPDTEDPAEVVTGPGGQEVTARELWRWIRDGGSVSAEDRVDLTALLRSLPTWAVEDGPEVEHLLETHRRWARNRRAHQGDDDDPR
ncbi:helix-turn-helix domain-containing protein [Corynebacterium provencense]|uniref:helix-turn-helix domain-containing protein n=1 Tax=Corynebacterium provencense TaxID=1737425 RepID=UPI00082D7AC1|nr:helix-turn-helix transcriptional regulator [Corynebacterium provencense]